MHVGVKCIFAGCTRLLSCFSIFWIVRGQFCSFEFVVHSLFSMDLPFALMSYPCLAKSWGNHSTWYMPFLYINYMLNFVHKFSIGVSMELVVVNMDIILLTSGLRLSKSTFFYMKTSWRGGLCRHWSKHFYLYPFLNKDWVFEFCKMQVWVLRCCKFSNGFMVEPWWEFRR